MKRKLSRLDNQGFTILELLIATAVLSVILVLVTSVMINVGNLFYKGVSISHTQDDARSIANQVSQDLKDNETVISSPAPNGCGNETLDSHCVTVSAYCIGSVRYSYILDQKLGTGIENDGSNQPESPHILWRDNTTASLPSSDLVSVPAGTTCQPVNVTMSDLSADTSGTELIAANSRLTQFQITGTQPYTFSVAVAYGNYSLLDFSQNPVACKGGTGDQFCGTANLTITIAQGLVGGT